MEAFLCFKESESYIIGAKFLEVNNTWLVKVDGHTVSVYHIYCNKKNLNIIYSYIRFFKFRNQIL